MWQRLFGNTGNKVEAGGVERVAAAAGAAGSGPATREERDVDAAEAHRRTQAGSLLVDVREPDEWRSGHAPGARLIPLGQLPAKLGQLPRDREIIVVCASGNRSSAAAGVLRRAGFGQVRNLRGGMYAWQRQRLPVEC